MRAVHELSIAVSIAEIACEEAERHGALKVRAVRLQLGALAGVVREALLFSWDIACAETALAGCRLDIEEVPARIWCASCSAERTISSAPFDARCPECGAAAAGFRGGRELQITALEIEDGTG